MTGRIFLYFLFSLLVEGALASPIQISELMFDSQREEYKRLSNQPRYRVTLNLLENEKFGDALSSAESLVNETPYDYLSNLLVALAYVGNDDFKQLQQYLEGLPNNTLSIQNGLKEIVFNAYFRQRRYFYALQFVSDDENLPLNPKSLYHLGLIYLAQGHMQDAKEILTKAYIKNPNDRDISLSLSRVYIVLGDYRKAQSLLELLNKTVSSDKKILQLLSSVYISLNKFSLAKKSYSALLKTNPKDFLANLNLGVISMIEGNLDTSSEYFSMALKVDETSADAYIGYILTTKSKNWKTHLANISDNSITQDPIFNLLKLSVSQGESASATELASYYFPDLAYADGNLSNLLSLKLVKESLLYRLGYYEQVIQSTKLSAEKASNLHKIMRARSLIKKGRDEEAKVIYQRLIKENDEHAVSARVELAEIEYRQGDYQTAEKYYKWLIAKDSRRADWKLQISNIYLQVGKLDQAVNELNNALSLQFNALILNQIAAINSEYLDNQDEAIRIAMLGRKSFDDYPILLETIGWAFYKKEDIGKAVYYYNLLLESTGSKHTATTFYRMGLVYQSAGMLGAKTFFELALNEGRDFEWVSNAKKNLGFN